MVKENEHRRISIDMLTIFQAHAPWPGRRLRSSPCRPSCAPTVATQKKRTKEEFLSTSQKPVQKRFVDDCAYRQDDDCDDGDISTSLTTHWLLAIKESSFDKGAVFCIVDFVESEYE